MSEYSTYFASAMPGVLWIDQSPAVVRWETPTATASISPAVCTRQFVPVHAAAAAAAAAVVKWSAAGPMKDLTAGSLQLVPGPASWPSLQIFLPRSEVHPVLNRKIPRVRAQAQALPLRG